MEENESRYRRYKRNLERVKLVGQANKIRKHMIHAAERFEKQNRVKNTTIILMILAGLCFDGLQDLLNFIPVLGWVWSTMIGFYAWLTFYMWTSAEGWGIGDTAVKKVTGKAFLRFCANYLLPFISLIPFVNDLPEITLGVILSILILKSDDFLYNKTKGRVDQKTIKEGVEFFNLFRSVL